MTGRIVVAGAAGAIGRWFVPLLVAAGHAVVGTTRSPARAEAIRAMGAEAVVVDVFDAGRLVEAVVAAGPTVVVHQLTDLPPGLDPSRMQAAVAGNARIREEGTANLVRAALAAGAGRLVAQSIAWAYAPGPLPHGEDDPLDLGAEGSRAVSVGGVATLERLVLGSPPLVSTVLRYGHLYGPGTGADTPPASMPLHVDDAAHAALLAVERNAAGIYNVAEPNAEVATDRIGTALGWRPAARAAF